MSEKIIKFPKVGMKEQKEKTPELDMFKLKPALRLIESLRKNILKEDYMLRYNTCSEKSTNELIRSFNMCDEKEIISNPARYLAIVDILKERGVIKE